MSEPARDSVVRPLPLPGMTRPSGGESRGGARSALSSVTAAPPQGTDPRPPAPRSPGTREAFRRHARAARALASGQSFWDSQPPSLAALRRMHHDAAQRHASPLTRFLRHAWGVLHLLVASAAYSAVWLVYSFITFAVAVLLVCAVIMWR